ncbi:hypothetical protein TMatcc_001122 [Talaromyces marneffei ATCC 18224]
MFVSALVLINHFLPFSSSFAQPNSILILILNFFILLILLIWALICSKTGESCVAIVTRQFISYNDPAPSTSQQHPFLEAIASSYNHGSGAVVPGIESSL